MARHTTTSLTYRPVRGIGDAYLILKTKGCDELMEVKRGAAERWVRAVNADGRHGHWSYALALNPNDVVYLLNEGVRRNESGSKPV